MANEYATVEMLKLALAIQADDATQDAQLQQALAAAARGIDRDTGRRFWLDPAPVQRVYNPRGRTVCDESGERILVDDVGSTTGLVVETGPAGGPWTAVTDYETAPDNALVDGRPITALLRSYGSWGQGGNRVRVTARFGWPGIPDEVIEATKIQANRLFKRKDSPEGVASAGEWGVVRVSRVDPDVYALIKHFVLPGFG